jgi:hypothetical protein
MWPYSQILFQWSVHRQLSASSELEHDEFLADNDSDPRLEFINSLCDVVGISGQIVVYYASFESGRLRELADRLPAYRRRIEKIQERLWDLLPFVKRNVYHPEFNGSFSIKSVLPALVPELTYGGMEVANGTDAGVAWQRMIRGECDPAERQRLRLSLLAYCSQDTLAMVKIIERSRILATSLVTAGESVDDSTLARPSKSP